MFFCGTLRESPQKPAMEYRCYSPPPPHVAMAPGRKIVPPPGAYVSRSFVSSHFQGVSPNHSGLETEDWPIRSWDPITTLSVKLELPHVNMLIGACVHNESY